MTAYLFAQVCRAAGLPPGVLNIVHGLGARAGAPLTAHPDVPTISFTHERLQRDEAAAKLAAQGIFAWHGNIYALPVTEALGLEPHGLVRIGLLHYNTTGEVDRLLQALDEL